MLRASPIRLLFAARAELLTRVLGVVTSALSTALAKRVGPCASGAETGLMTLVQRFGSALNLDVHLHILALDGVHTFRYRIAVGPQAQGQDAPVHHPSGGLRPPKSAILPTCHRPPRRPGAASTQPPHPLPRPVRPERTPPPPRRPLATARTGERWHNRTGAGSHASPDDVGPARSACVFDIDNTRCPHGGAALRVFAVITDPRVIAAILAHLDTRAARVPPPPRH